MSEQVITAETATSSRPRSRIDIDERDGMTLEEMKEMAERDREQQDLEDEPDAG